MNAESKKRSRQETWPSELGAPRGRGDHDLRRDPVLLGAIAQVAPGTPLRDGIDDIIRAHEGALIVLGNPSELSFLYSGGMELDLPFKPQLLYELAKMDGAIIVTTDVTKIAYANVQLMPDPDDRVERDRHAPPHGRTRGEANGCARGLDLTAA